MTCTTIIKLNRNPTHGVWGDQRVPGRPNKVLEERGRGFPRLAQTPGSKHSNYVFWKEIPDQFVPALRPSSNYLFSNDDEVSIIISFTRPHTSQRKIWDKGDQNYTWIFLGLRDHFANWILIDIVCLTLSTGQCPGSLCTFSWISRIGVMAIEMQISFC